MRRGYGQFCAIARTLDLVGQRWTLLVVRELALRGPLTAAAIARGLPDVPMNQLSERLAALEAHGLIASHARVYELTEMGRSLEPVLTTLADFGLAHLAAAPARDEVVLPHVLMRQLELRFDSFAASASGFSGRFELELSDPEAMWSVEPGVDAPARWALVAGPDGLSIRAGACLDADALMRTTVASCIALVAADSQAGLEVEVEGDAALALQLLHLLGARPAALAAAA